MFSAKVIRAMTIGNVMYTMYLLVHVCMHVMISIAAEVCFCYSGDLIAVLLVGKLNE